jgi:hypothetical protein
MNGTRKRLTGFVLLALGLAAVAFVACGGGDEPEPPQAQPTAPPQQAAPPSPTPQPAEETGLVVEDLNLEAKGAGGRVKFTVTNSADAPCNGSTVFLDLLRGDGSVASQLGVQAFKLEPGESKELEERYIGSTIENAVVTSTTCKASTLSDDTSPSRAQTPVPGK